jgi:hypothetical protein
VENVEYLSYTTGGFFRNMTQFYCHNKAGDVMMFFGGVLLLVMFFGDVLLLVTFCEVTFSDR